MHYIDQLINRGELKATVRKRGKKRIYLIEAVGVENLKREFQSLLTVEQVAERLNISERSVLDLVGYKCLQPRRGPTIDGLSFWRIASGEVDRLFEKLESNLTQSRIRKVDERVGFSTALRMLSLSNYSLGQFLLEVLDGNLKPCGKGRDRGIKMFLFSKADIYILRDRPKAKNDQSFLRREPSLALTSGKEQI